jgi:hypothetical protein
MVQATIYKIMHLFQTPIGKLPFQTPIGKLPVGVFTLIFFVYLLLIGGDIFTTYLASPQLRYEYNPVIIHFDMNWVEIVAFSILVAFLIFLCFVISLNKLAHNSKKEYWGVCLLGVTIFISHFGYTIFTIANNVLSGVYLGNIDIQCFNSISEWYINEMVQIKWFYEIVLGFYFLISFFLVKVTFRNE